MADTPTLGFEIDTSPLEAAANALTKVTDAAGKAAEATDTLTEAQKGGEAQAKLWGAMAGGNAPRVAQQADATKKAAEETEKLAKAQQQHTQTSRTSTQASEAQARQVERIAIEVQKATAAILAQTAAEAAAAKERAGQNSIIGQLNGLLAGHRQEVTGVGQQWQVFGEHLKSGGQTLQGMTAQILAMSAGMGGLSQGTGIVASAVTGAVGTVMRVAPAFGTAGIAVGAMAGGMAALGAATVGVLAPLASAADGAAIMEARLKVTLGTTTAAKEAIEALRETANRTGSAFDVTADAFLRFSRANDTIGATRAQLQQMTENVQKLGVISGATPADMQGGLIQFSQALSRGRLEGQELRSLQERFPALIQTIADGLGKSVGQIREMGASGELTAHKIVTALLGATEKINKQFEEIPSTTRDAFTRVSNSWELLLEHMGQKLQASPIMQGFARMVQGTIQALDSGLRPKTPWERAEELRAGDERSRENEERSSGGLIARAQRRQGGRQSRANENTPYGKMTPAGLQALEIEYDAMAEAASVAFPDAMTDRQALLQPYKAANTVIDQGDQQAARIKRMREELAILVDGLKVARENPLELTSPQDEERIAKLPGYIESYRRQIENTLPAAEKLWQTTNRRSDALTSFGGGGGGAIAAAVEQMRDQAAAANQIMPSVAEAQAAIIASRVVDVRTQTADLGQQIEAQGRLTAAIGKGRDASIAAEAANKALNLTYQTFGSLTTPAATAALVEYESALRKLLNAQREAADQQTLLNQQMDAAVAATGLAAVRAGATPGAVSYAEAQERFAQRRSAILGDGSQPAGTRPGSAAVTPPPATPSSMTDTLAAPPPAGSVLAGLLAPAGATGANGATGTAGGAPAAPYTGAAPRGMEPEVASAIAAEAAKQGRDARVMMGVSMVESGGRNIGANSIGATGTFQLMPDTAKGLGVDRTDLGQNVRGGVTYFGQQLDAVGGNPYAAYARYHDGPNARTAAAYARTGDLNTLGPEGQKGVLRLEQQLTAMGLPGRTGVAGSAAPGATVAPIPTSGRDLSLRVLEGEKSAYETGLVRRAETTEQANRLAARQARERIESDNPVQTRRRQQADNESAQYGPAQQGGVKASILARQSAEDEEQIRRREVGMQRQIDLTGALMQADKLAGVERDVAIAQARNMNDIRASGLPYTEQQIEAEQRLTAVMATQGAQRRQLYEMRNLGMEVGDALSSAMENAATKGMKFKDVLKGLEADLMRILWREAVTKPLSNALGSLFSGGNGDTGQSTSALSGIAGLLGKALGGAFGGGGAAAAGASAGYTMAPATGTFAAASALAAAAADGKVFDRGNVIPFAGGGIVTRPTLFAMSGGRTGQMGEAGPEAIIPLQRGPDGRLGVQATGGQAQQPAAARQMPSLTINVTTPDADSFRRSQGQIAASAQRIVSRANRNL